MWEPERLQLAKQHFGNPLRLQLAEWVLAEGRDTAFKQQEAVDGVRAVTKSASSAPSHLAHFVEAGMLQRTTTGTGNVYYAFLEHPLWAAYRAILDSLKAVDVGSNGGSAARTSRGRP